MQLFHQKEQYIWPYHLHLPSCEKNLRTIWCALFGTGPRLRLLNNHLVKNTLRHQRGEQFAPSFAEVSRKVFKCRNPPKRMASGKWQIHKNAPAIPALHKCWWRKMKGRVWSRSFVENVAATELERRKSRSSLGLSIQMRPRLKDEPRWSRESKDSTDCGYVTHSTLTCQRLLWLNLKCQCRLTIWMLESQIVAQF